MIRVCAWHPLFIGAPQPPDIAFIMEGTEEPQANRIDERKCTHGICKACAERMRKENGLDGTDDA